MLPTRNCGSTSPICIRIVIRVSRVVERTARSALTEVVEEDIACQELVGAT